MKRNWIVIAFMSLLTVALWAQTAATTTAPATDTKAAGCACCNMGDKAAAQHDMSKMKDHAGMSCCSGKDAKDGMACARKDGKGCCAGMKAAKATTTADAKAGCGKDCCGKDCCKDGKCEMAKNGKSCCDKCNMSEKTAAGQ
jgi:hypothetical protein